MTLAKGGESFALSAGYFKGENLVGIWNKGVYIPFSAGFLTIKGYVILMEDVVENSLTDEVILNAVKANAQNFEAVKMSSPFDIEVNYKESEVAYVNENVEYPFAFFAVEKTAVKNTEKVVPKVKSVDGVSLVKSTSYRVGEMTVNGVDYYVMYNTSNITGEENTFYPRKETV